MKERSGPRFLVPFLWLIFMPAGSDVFADRLVYEGEGRSQGQEMVMTLGNGDRIVVARSDGVATLNSEPRIVFNTVCFAMGVVGDKDESRSDFYCTFREEAGESGFDLKGFDNGTGAEARLIGGAGRWDGMTGRIEFDGQSTQGAEKSYRYVLTVEGP